MIDRIGPADLVVTLDDCNLMVIGFDDLEDFLHSLLKFGVTNTAANVESYEDIGLMIAQMAR